MPDTDRYHITIDVPDTDKPANVSYTVINNYRFYGERKPKKKKKKDKIVIADVINNSVKKAVGMFSSDVGEITRDSLLQRQVSSGLSLVNTAVAFKINPIYGAINASLDIANEILRYNIKAERENNRLKVMLNRASYNNRSR